MKIGRVNSLFFCSFLNSNFKHYITYKIKLIDFSYSKSLVQHLKIILKCTYKLNIYIKQNLLILPYILVITY